MANAFTTNIHSFTLLEFKGFRAAGVVGQNKRNRFFVPTTIASCHDSGLPLLLPLLHNIKYIPTQRKKKRGIDAKTQIYVRVVYIEVVYNNTPYKHYAISML